jgi:hypothetical protein
LLIQMSILPLPNAATGGEQLRAKVILAIQKKPGNRSRTDGQFSTSRTTKV